MSTENTTNNVVAEKYAEFTKLINRYAPKADTSKVCVHKTEKGNWEVYDENHKLITLASKILLTDEVIEKYNIQFCERPVKLKRPVKTSTTEETSTPIQ
jgi:hypothetical protein